MKNTRFNLLVSLSGRLTKLILHGTGKKLAMLKQFAGPMTFCSLRPRKRNYERFKGCFFIQRTYPTDCSNLGKRRIIKIAKGAFSRNSSVFLSKTVCDADDVSKCYSKTAQKRARQIGIYILCEFKMLRYQLVYFIQK